MTEQELKTVPFHWVSHLSMEGEHCTTYASEDGRLGWCAHVPIDPLTGEPKGRPYRHYQIDGKVYKSKKKFLEALADFSPKIIPIRKNM